MRSKVWVVGVLLLLAVAPDGAKGQYFAYYYDYDGDDTTRDEQQQPPPATEADATATQDLYSQLYYDYDVPEVTPAAALEEVNRVQAVVFGGTQAETGRFDYVVSIFKLGSHTCGGTLIEPDVVLTAAQCVANRRTARFPPTVYIKRERLDQEATEGQTFGVRQTVVHPGFNPATLDNDVALLKLDRPSDVTTLPNYFINAELTPGSPLTVLGYGVTGEGSRRSDTLQEGTVAFEPTDGCVAVYGDRITGSMVCASSPNAQDACQGDSGGPLVQEGEAGDILVGIISWGDGCAEVGKPGVYASVASVRTWVEDTLLALGSA